MPSDLGSLFMQVVKTKWRKMQPAEPDLGQENGFQPISDPSVLLNSCGMTQQVPNIWSFEYQMGPQVYHDALVSSQDLGFLRRQIWVDSNSSFSDHINFIQQEIQRRTELLNSQLSTPLSAMPPVPPTFSSSANGLNGLQTLSSHDFGSLNVSHHCSGGCDVLVY